MNNDDFDHDEWLKRCFNFSDEQCKMHTLLTEIWHLSILPNKDFARVLRKILAEVENV